MEGSAEIPLRKVSPVPGDRGWVVKCPMCQTYWNVNLHDLQKHMELHHGVPKETFNAKTKLHLEEKEVYQCR